METIVISAVNLVEAGTLKILQDCLSYLSEWKTERASLRIIAVVHAKTLANYAGIEYIETTWPKKRWLNRLWYEYVSLKKISKQIGEIDLWLSLHDTSPTVIARKRAVYCHNTYMFYKWSLADFRYSPKIAAFALFTKYIYKPNIKLNDFIIVQQQWLKVALAEAFKIPQEKFIVARPPGQPVMFNGQPLENKRNYTFLYPASPNSHKNFECLCEAARILQERRPSRPFTVVITVEGNENKYASFLKKRWGSVEALSFVGFLSRQRLQEYYATADCLVFPSKIESWGLPVSEFIAYNKPMLLADLPYAHETAAGESLCAFFNPDRPDVLANQMYELLIGNNDFLGPSKPMETRGLTASDWKELFDILLNGTNA